MNPNIVIKTHSGGAHCCSTFYVYSINPDNHLIELAVLEAEHGGNFDDLDHDGRLEFVMYDWHWAYQLTCYTCLQYPRIVLRFVDGTYRLAYDLMWKPAPTESEFRSLLDQIMADDKTPNPGFDAMLDLIYTGNAHLAKQVADECWPDDLDAAKALAEFGSILVSSPYWPELKDWVMINAGPEETDEFFPWTD